MKFPLTLVLLGSALAAQADAAQPGTPAAHGRALSDLGSPVVLVADDDEEGGTWLSFGGDDDSSGEECDDDEETCPPQGRANAAPAGTVAPPANGLFGDGKAPKASMN